MSTDRANRPVNYVSFWDACRFANWLHNGQPTGLQNASTTERGAYTLDGFNGSGAVGQNIRRNPAAKWVVPTENEWYKAAYYKGGGTNAGYWEYPTQSNTLPSNVGADGYTDPGNHANYRDSINGNTIGSPYYRTNVGEFENSVSAYGTYDQGGNVWEYNETVVRVDQYAYRGYRGGADYTPGYYLSASLRPYGALASSQYEPGFRVALVPESSGLMVLVTGILSLAGLIRTRRNG